MTPKQERSIKQRVGRAIAAFRRDNGGKVSCHVYTDGDSALISTHAADGDNVSWARKPMDSYIWPALNGICTESPGGCHCCGDVSATFVLR